MGPATMILPRTKRFWNLIVSLAVWCACSTPGVAQTQGDPVAVRALLSTHLPRKGAVEAVFAASSGGAAEVDVGFDAASGSWYIATDHSVTLRQPSGAVLSGPPRPGGLVNNASLKSSTADLSMIDWLPTCFLLATAREQWQIDSVEHLPTGSYVFAIPTDAFLPGKVRVFCEVDGQGVLRRNWRDDPQDRRERAIEYSDESPPGFPVPRKAAGGLSLASITFHPEGGIELFAKERVESIAAQARVNVTKALAALSGGASESGADPAVTRIAPGRQSPAFEKYRWPLLALGVLLVLIGLVYRARSRA